VKQVRDRMDAEHPLFREGGQDFRNASWDEALESGGLSAKFPREGRRKAKKNGPDSGIYILILLTTYDKGLLYCEFLLN